MRQDEIETWLIEELHRLRAAVTGTASATGDPDMIDSLEGVELIVAAEIEFGIKIPDASLNRQTCSSLRGIAGLIADRVAATARRTA